jgi:hypothetical protein
MSTKSSTILSWAFAGSFFGVGLPYWRIPYARLSLPDDIWGFGLVLVACFAALPRVVGAARLWPATLIVGAAVPAAVMARVLYDVLRDATSHNLWPFEIILVLGPGFAAALAGACVGGLLARLRST